MRSRKIDTLILNLFTFHYGPIQIESTENMELLIFTHLHSTMVLFKYDMLTYATDEYNEFTFHYGPIQIHKCL